jgi:hypothetical protein
MKRRYILILVSILIIAAVAITGFSIKNRVQTQVKELFIMNKQLQEEGYYMAEFEFQMLGFAYFLDKGMYLKALSSLSDFHTKLQNKEGLIKIPAFSNDKEEIDFYLNLQNPLTGAFMDEKAPFCTYFSVTENILLHLEALRDSATSPIKLKYPLTFLDEINTPQKLIEYLNDISYVGWMGAKFPQTSFHFARDILSNAAPDNVIVRHDLYQFSPEWKQTMFKWMYEFQDPKTGLWGPKNKKTHELVKLDLNNTSSILKTYRDKNGNDIYEEFPLNYEEKMINSVLELLSEPMPADDDLAEIHEWNLRQVKGIKMLLTRLWKDVSVQSKELAKQIIENFIEIAFDKYYVEEDRAFSYYPDADHATADGMTNMILNTVGALSYSKQKLYWGDPTENTAVLGIVEVDSILAEDLDIIMDIPGINSWRIYQSLPDFKTLTDNVWAVVYPKPTKVLDITELVPNIHHWLESSSLSTGNWKSMTEIKNEFASIYIKKPLIYKNELPCVVINEILGESSEIFIMGYDVLQVPRLMVEVRKK